MFDEAEKKIARLIAESTTAGANTPKKYKICASGSGNMVAARDINLTIHFWGQNGDLSGQLSPPNKMDQATQEQSHDLILCKCQALGDPGLYLPFIKAAYGAQKLSDLGPGDLRRLEWWLGIRSDRPT